MNARGRGRGRTSVRTPQPKDDTEKPVPDGCICSRKVSGIICIQCGYFLCNHSHIRVRKLCPIHPKVFYISDLTRCPDCRKPETLEEVAPGEADEDPPESEDAMHM